MGPTDALTPEINIVKTAIHDPACEADIDGTGVVVIGHPGENVTYQYNITNPGDWPLDVTSLIDDNGTPGDLGDDIDLLVSGIFVGGDTNNDGYLDPGEEWVYQFTKPLTDLGYTTNTVVVQGTPVDANEVPITALGTVTASDDERVFVAEAAISIEKRVNSKDANVEPPEFDHVLLGSAVNFTYLVTNNGNIALSLSDIVDDNATVDGADDFNASPVLKPNLNNIGDVNDNGRFDPGETWEFEALAVVVDTLGLRTNIASVTGTPIDINGEAIDEECIAPVSDTDPASIYVDQPAILLDKSIVLGEQCQADVDGTGVVPIYHSGDSATFRYTLTNPGTVALQITSLIDDNGTPGDLGDDLDILTVGTFISGDTDNDGFLDIDETWVYEYSKPVVALGTYTNTAVVIGQPVGNDNQQLTSLGTVTSTDDAVLYVADVGINLEKRVNGKDANSEPPAFDHILLGSAVNFTYLVTNTGNVILSLSDFVDDNGTPGDMGDDFTPTPCCRVVSILATPIKTTCLIPAKLGNFRPWEF